MATNPRYEGTNEVLGYTVDFHEVLGSGAFGIAYKGYDIDNNVVALKHLKTGNKKANHNASVEAARLYELKGKQLHQHNNHIVKIHDVRWYKMSKSMWIVMEYCDLGNLDDYFKAFSPMLQAIGPKISLMRQIINGIAFLHSQGIVHRDIKPNNILVKAERFTTIKIADFSLTKILDPDSSTSGMYTNAGSPRFKAPELWAIINRVSGQVERYHRNIDVYSAALTFLAMLQFQPEDPRHLTPRAEGSLQLTEINMPIGQAVYNRMVNKLPPVTVVQCTVADCTLTKYVKRVIRKMTRVIPNDRPSASEVEAKFSRVFSNINPTRCYSVQPSESFLSPTDMCFVNNLLWVRRTSMGSEDSCVMNAIDIETGESMTSNKSRCNHVEASIATCRVKDDTKREAVVKACAPCDVIRVHDIAASYPTTSVHGYPHIQHGALCDGPENTLIVYDRSSKYILQLAYNDSTLNYMRKFGPLYSPPLSMCYNQHHGILVILSMVRPHVQIKGINLTAGEVLWQRFGTPGSLNVCSGYGGVFVSGYGDTITVHDAADGLPLETLLSDENLGHIRQVACSEKYGKLAVLHGPGQITCYSLQS